MNSNVKWTVQNTKSTVVEININGVMVLPFLFQRRTESERTNITVFIPAVAVSQGLRAGEPMYIP
jgi:hypothetical protein